MSLSFELSWSRVLCQTGIRNNRSKPAIVRRTSLLRSTTVLQISASAYRPLSAFKTQEMSDIVKRDSDTSFALFVQTKLEFRIMISKVIYLFKHQRQRAERYDTRYYCNVRSKADVSQLNLPHGTDN